MDVTRRDENLRDQNNNLIAKVTSKNYDTAKLKASIKALQNVVTFFWREKNRPPPGGNKNRPSAFNSDKLKHQHYH